MKRFWEPWPVIPTSSNTMSLIRQRAARTKGLDPGSIPGTSAIKMVILAQWYILQSTYNRPNVCILTGDVHFGDGRAQGA